MKTLFNYNNKYQVIEGEQIELLERAIDKFVKLSQTNPGIPKHISMFGGTTVFKLFQCLENHHLFDKINWNDIHLWWGDERLVSFDSHDSNYGELNRRFLQRINIPETNIHPMGGFDGNNANEKIEAEVVRISNLTQQLVTVNQAGVPSFDLVYLGIGDDGHTASLFPGTFNSKDENLYCSTIQPSSGMPRLSSTIHLINAAKQICFIAFGKAKAPAIAKTLNVISRKLLFTEAVKAKGHTTEFAEQLFYSSISEPVSGSPLDYIGLLDNNSEVLLDSESSSELNFSHLDTFKDNLDKILSKN